MSHAKITAQPTINAILFSSEMIGVLPAADGDAGTVTLLDEVDESV